MGQGTITWEYWGITKTGGKVDGTIQTKSSRSSKVAKIIENHLMDVHKLTFLHFEEFGFNRVKK